MHTRLGMQAGFPAVHAPSPTVRLTTCKTIVQTISYEGLCEASRHKVLSAAFKIAWRTLLIQL